MARLLDRLRKSLLLAEGVRGSSDEICLSVRQLVAEGDAETGGIEWRAGECERLAPLLVRAKRAAASRDSALAKARHESKMKPLRLARQVGPKALSVPVPTWDKTSSSPLSRLSPLALGSRARVPMSGQSLKASPSRSRSGPTLKIQRPSRVLQPDGSLGSPLTTPSSPLPPLSSESRHAASPLSSGGLPAVMTEGSPLARGGLSRSATLPALRTSADSADLEVSEPCGSRLAHHLIFALACAPTPLPTPPHLHLHTLDQVPTQLKPFKIGVHELSIAFSIDPDISSEQHETDLQASPRPRPEPRPVGLL